MTAVLAWTGAGTRAQGERRPVPCPHGFVQSQKWNIGRLFSERGPSAVPRAWSSLPPTAAASGAHGPAPAGCAPSLEWQEWHWSSAVGQEGLGLEGALQEAVEEALGSWPLGAEPQLAFLFVSAGFGSDDLQRVLPALREWLPSLQHVLGCLGTGVVGTQQAWSGQAGRPALSLTLAALPGVSLRTFHIAPSTLPGADAPPQAWHRLLGVAPEEPGEGHTSFVLLGDAGFNGVEGLLQGLDYAYPTARTVGGLSGGAAAGTPGALWQWSAEAGPEGASEGGRQSSGCVGLALQGPLLIDSLLAQGCTPLGSSVYRVTRAEGGVVLELQQEQGHSARAAGAAAIEEPESWGGESSWGAGWATADGWVRGEEAGSSGRVATPLEFLQQLLWELRPDERERAIPNIVAGLAADPFQAASQLQLQDFEERRVLGAGPRAGWLKLEGSVRVGQRLVFLVQSREGAGQALVSSGVAFKRRELQALWAGRPLPPPLGCLLFSSGGGGRGNSSSSSREGGVHRGLALDTKALAGYVRGPRAGLLCESQIVKAREATRLHGFSCSTAVFRPTQQEHQWQQLQRRLHEQLLAERASQGEPPQEQDQSWCASSEL